jgi:CRISPR-associated exonuclease Cas4
MTVGSDRSVNDYTFAEEDLLPISTLQHLLFCERRVALVYTEGIWAENTFTVDGRRLNERAEELDVEAYGDLRIVRGLRLRSLRLGLSGKADVVEFHRVTEALSNSRLPECRASPLGVALPGASGLWRPFPVEYKRGRLRSEEGYEVQLCAQALCLEEMLHIEVPAGAIFFGKTRRRLEVAFTSELRQETNRAAVRLHELLRSGKTPRAQHKKKCEGCSLFDQCLPTVFGRGRSAQRYLQSAFWGDDDEEGRR